MKTIWSDNAIDRLREHVRTIAENDGKKTAGKWLYGLQRSVALVETFPTMYPVSHIAALAKFGIREIFYSGYRVFYVVREKDCRIVSVLNCRQNIVGTGDL